jgi:hypothetical protein
MWTRMVGGALVVIGVAACAARARPDGERESATVAAADADADATTLRRDFFADVMGVDEPTFRTWSAERVAAAVSVRDDDDGHRAFELHAEDGTIYQAGWFEEPSIGDLRAATRDLHRGGGSFSVVDGERVPGDRPNQRVDVGGLQAAPDNDDAVFQVASNFNALETVSPEQNIDAQLLTSYVGDHTQGPAAAISAAPGLILRSYFLYYDPETPPVTWRQSTDHQVNLLADVPDLTMSRAGYVRLDAVVQAGTLPTDDDVARMRVGFHGGVQVSHGYMRDYARHDRLVARTRAQTVNQVYVAAVDFGTNARLRTPRVNGELGVAERWAKAILAADYEGTLRAAAAEGKRRVVLTLVGGGAFGNDLAWIGDALEPMAGFIADAGLDVVLIGRDRLPAAFAARMNELSDRVAAAGDDDAP